MNIKRKMFFKMLFYSLIRRRSRIIIALLSIIVGATILSGLVTIYTDVPRQMSSEFRNYGANVILSPNSEEFILDNEIDEALKTIPSNSVEGYTPYRYENTMVNNMPVTMAGINFKSIEKTSPYWSINGRKPESDGEVLIGKKVANTFEFKVGSKMTLKTKEKEVTSEIETLITEDDFTYEVDGIKYVDRELELDIVGILETGGTEEEYIYLSYNDVTYITFSNRGYDLVELSISGTSDKLKSYVDSINNSSTNINAKLVKRVTESESSVLTKLQSLVFIVTVVVLVLTMICVATTMTAVIAERRKEIGLRKTLGASNKDIAKEFMFEGLVLGTIGGIFGSILGYVFALVISLNVFSSAITFRPLLVPITIIAAIAVSAISCLIPVRTAVKVEPAIVLKGE
ncbi:MAG: FtsX-like permease family protein [Acholeplasmatales bacterium]|nr:FtsX-like permease family protein [Acholeplasmatales bacterium]